MCSRLVRAVLAGIVVAVLAAHGSAYAQSDSKYPVVTSTLEPTSATVGQQLKLSVNIVVPELTRISVKAPFVDAKDTTWTSVAKPVTTDEKLSSNEWRRHIDYTIASFELGDIPAPKVEITYQPPGSADPVTRTTPDEIVHINSLLPQNAEQVNLRDIKPPMPLPFPRWIFWTASGLGAALLAFAAYFIWRRLRGRVATLLRPPLALDEWAFAEIEKLEGERLIEHKKLKELYTRLSDTVRQYYGKLLNFPALDMTSGELLFQLEDIEGEQHPENIRSFHDARVRTKELLDEADLVKFAKFLPDPAQCRHAMEKAREIVRLTRYKLQPDPQPQGSTPTAPPTLPPAPSRTSGPASQEFETQSFRPAPPSQPQGARVD